MKRKKLPFVQTFVDRHRKKVRHYFRRRGWPRVPLPGSYGSPEFLAAYEAAFNGIPRQIGSNRTLPGTMGALIVAYYESAEFKGLAPETQRTYRNLMERLREQHGDKGVASLEAKHIRRILDTLSDKPGAAYNVRRAFRVLMRFAVERGWRKDNPALAIRKPKGRSGGYRTWTEAEIEAFEAKWPHGSRERLALALLLHTGQRRSDVVRMGRQHLKDGFLHVRQQKTGTSLAIPVSPELKQALQTAPNGLTFLVTKAGKPFEPESFTNWFVKAAQAAGLPKGLSPHGLRKAAATRLAEAGCSAHEIMSITGHKSLSEVATYTSAASQAKLAVTAMKTVAKAKQRTKRVKPT